MSVFNPLHTSEKKFLLQRCLKVIDLCFYFAFLLKFIYSERASKFCKISTLLVTVCTVGKSIEKISPNIVAFSEYMNFNTQADNSGRCFW